MSRSVDVYDSEVDQVPISVMVRRYQCPHCHRTFAKKASAKGHMATCPSDPGNRACKTCRHYNRCAFGDSPSYCEVGKPFQREPVTEFDWTLGFDVVRPAGFRLYMNCELWVAR